MKSVRVSALFYILLSCALVSPVYAAEKRIALTYDDAPRSDAVISGDDRAAMLIAGLEAAGVEQAGFFITTSRINSPERLQRIQSYAAAGHVLANHSHTHPWLREVTAEEYLADIDRASETMALFENTRPWFRFPYLNEAPTVEKRDAVRAGLVARDLRNAYVTVDNYDWYLESLYQRAVKAGEAVCMSALSDLYTDMLVDAANFFNDVAVETMGHSPAHTLLLHENDIAALFVLDLVAALEADGWEIITVDEAYQDPIADIEPDTRFLGQGRVAAIASLNGRSPKTFDHFAINEDQIETAFREEYGVIGDRTD
ncbi:polysaccharide deacetylase family protein [Parvularcula sp. IMCC14364]|uniref:polysaccharide deacetylase family protein n=1 Tax=Parvularcula sp. IMCC14364 TaxID=3067902 RepID=UPI002741C1C9|nr:polysaccharide deacetylase family protein [Parvularcula sp. IMCC14364]